MLTSPSRPTPRHRRFRGRQFGLAAFVGLASLASASSASAACAPTATTKFFSKLGDTADYSLAPGGSFESGTSGWSLGGASVVSAQQTAVASKGSKALSIPAKSVVVSAPFCVGQEHPHFRFVARRTSGSWGVLLAQLRWTDGNGRVNTTTIAGLNGTDWTSWKPTANLQLATTLPFWTKGQSYTAQIVFDPEDSGGNWQIDDVYIDPFRRA